MKALVMSSGGIDSTACLSFAVHKYGADNITTLSFQYGQKHPKELECADQIAKYYGVAHKVIDLRPLDIFAGSSCTLLSGAGEIPTGSYEDQIDRADNGKVSTYVPFRNGLMLSIAAAIAMSLYPDELVEIFIGAHADDAAGNAYADCSSEFLDYMHLAVDAGTYNLIKIISPLGHMNKSEVVQFGMEYDAPFDLTWSCYAGGDRQCGKCGTCLDRKKAFESNGLKDPVGYLE